jgi:hypothetical protein
MLNSVGMREPRASIRIVGRRSHRGFRALGRRPAGGTPSRLAHLHTAAADVRFGAMTEAAVRRNTPQQCVRVRAKRQRADQEYDSQEAELGEGPPPSDGFKEELAHGCILRKAWKKTDSHGSSIILLPGSCNPVARCAEKRDRDAVPDLNWNEFRIELEVRIWLRRMSFPQS